MIDYLGTHETARVNYKLLKARVLQYLHDLFDGDRQQFYMKIFGPAFSNYSQAKDFLTRNYSGVSRQIHMRQYLQGLSLKGIIMKVSRDTKEALEKLCESIA